MAEISEKSFPFDSEQVNGVFDRTYLADDFARYFRSFISSGIFMKQYTNLQVIANGDMTVTLNPGALIIDGYRYDAESDITITVEPADGIRNRIDRIAITWSKVDRDIHYTLQKGELSYDPAPPVCRRTADCKDYVVADIYVSAGAIKITQDNITDQRLNSEVCGLAFPFYDLDTTMVFNQLQAFYNKVVAENVDWKTALEAWCITLKDEKTASLQKIIDDCTVMKEGAETEFRDWFTSNTNNWEADWYSWFNNMKEQLTDEPATHLQQQIGNLNDLETEDKSNLTGAVNEVHNKVETMIPIVSKFIKATYKKTTSSNPNLVLECTFAELEEMVGVAILVEATNEYNTSTYVSLSSLTVEDSTGETRTARLGCPYISGVSGSAYNTTGYSSYINFNCINILTYAGSDTNASYPGGRFYNLTSTKLSISTTATYKSSSSSPFTGTGAYNMYTELIGELSQCLKCVETGEFTNDTITIQLRFDATYLLVTREITVSTSKVYGYRARIYASSKYDSLNTASVAPSAANLAASSNAGVTLGTVQSASYQTDSSGNSKLLGNYGITLKATGTYKVSYALYEFANSYGPKVEK